jgi:hypothetical protein
MERAPTEGSVIAPHPGIAGTADVGAAFGWTEPAASAELTALAETGNHAPLAALAMGSDAVGSVVAFPPPPDGVVPPGGSVSAMVSASASTGYLSLATAPPDGVVLPGASVSTMVTASSGMGYLSLATMLVHACGNQRRHCFR